MKKPSQQYFCELVNFHMIVGKAEIIDFMKQKQLKTSTNNTKAKLLDRIEKNDYLNEFYNKFKEHFTITFSDMSKVLDIQQYKLTALYNIGYFKDFKDKIKEVEEDSYRYGKYLKVYLPLEILDLNKEKIENDYAETFNRNFQLRLTTNTKEEAKEIQELLSKIFVVSSIPSTYETRNKEKFNTYIFGNLVPWERGCAQSPNYKPITKKISDIDDHFCELLSSEEYKKFEEIQDLRADIGEIEDIDLFQYALCMGILLMIDVFSFKDKRLTEQESE